jgi:signal transduction histidine kinase
MSEPTIERQLAGAELWARTSASDPQTRVLAGWEDGATFCAAVCTTDRGLAFCRSCPTDVATRAIETGRATSGRCPAGVRLLAFPAPRGDPDRAAVLRVGPPAPRAAAAVADRVRVAPSVLRRAARSADRADGRVSLAAARILRDPRQAAEWQVAQRRRSADRRRQSAAALAQMIATSEELNDSYRAARRQRTELEQSRRRLDRLARTTLRAKDDERARIAHQIHDTAAQSMVSAFRFLEAARTASAAGGAEEDRRVAAASERLVAAIGEIRAVLARLLPPGLEELGLAHALRGQLDQGAQGNGIRTHLAGELPRLEPWVEQALYGMATEAISNAVRHGAPGSIRVGLRVVRDRAVVTIDDDGQGFDPSSVVRSAGSGLGLLGMSRQASWLGGSARIQSRLGGGTHVRISIPVARHRRADSVAADPPATPPARKAASATQDSPADGAVPAVPTVPAMSPRNGKGGAGASGRATRT